MSAPRLWAAARAFALRHALADPSGACSDPAGLAAMPLEALRSVLGSDELATPSEGAVLRAALAWAGAEAEAVAVAEGGRRRLADALRLVRLGLLPPAELYATDEHPLLAACTDCTMQVARAVIALHCCGPFSDDDAIVRPRRPAAATSTQGRA